MPPLKLPIPGWPPPMPLLQVELPPYVVPKARGGGKAFYFQVPARLRPTGWAATYRLPIDPQKRTGLGDAEELAAVVADGKTLYARLEAERSGKPAGLRANTLPWLIQSFDQHLKTTPRKEPIAKATLRQYRTDAKKVLAWSKAGGHPDVRLMTRPGVIKFLSTLNHIPSARKHAASYLRGLMFHAMDLGVRTDNPCTKLNIETPDATVHIWTDAELQTMVDLADRLGYQAVATAMLIAHDEGPRPCDVLAFERKSATITGRADRQTERGHFTPFDGCFRYFQKKTKGWVVSPAGQRVRDRLAQQPELQRILVMNKNTKRAYNERVFLRDFTTIKDAAGLAHLQFRHLRHTFVVKAKRAGLDAISIAAKTGHDPKSVEDMLRKYYLPHDSEVASNATAQLEAHRAQQAAAKQ